MKDHKTSARTA